jgi:OOP family OmpA-OmpF porin
MNALSANRTVLALSALLALPVSGSLSAQQPELATEAEPEAATTVIGIPPADLTGMAKGPDVEGYISAQKDGRIRITKADGSTSDVSISEGTQIRSRSGFLGMASSKIAADALLNGLPVSVKTLRWGGGLVASQIRFRNGDFKTAAMIRTGTDQRFGEQAAATEALRGRMADIDKYNVRATTNVNFAVGQAVLTDQAKTDLCSTAAAAQATENALILVVGYTDSTGPEEFNQQLSEQRAARVVNYLQQACGWKPYRMLTPTGMAEADPLAPNDTWAGKAQNRRVAVNVLVSKSVDGL